MIIISLPNQSNYKIWQASNTGFDLKNPKSFENAGIKNVESYFDDSLSDWTKAPLRDGNGIRYYDGKGNSY